MTRVHLEEPHTSEAVQPMAQEQGEYGPGGVIKGQQSHDGEAKPPSGQEESLGQLQEAPTSQPAIHREQGPPLFKGSPAEGHYRQVSAPETFQHSFPYIAGTEERSSLPLFLICL